MKTYMFNEQKIENDYKYIFLCGTHFDKSQKYDKRKVLSEFLKKKHKNYRPIILEENFIFKKSKSKMLMYDDIHMKNLYQVEMLTNYLSDNNIIIHESISTGAEMGLFLSEQNAMEKTCLLVPDEMAVEEDKIGQFIRLAFMKNKNPVQVFKFYPRLVHNKLSNTVQNWHTYFYEDMVGENLSDKLMEFIKRSERKSEIKFTKSIGKVEQGYIHYSVRNQRLRIQAQPRVILCCIAAIFNIDECANKIFSLSKRTLEDYIQDIKEYLKRVFIETIEEKTGEAIKDCSIVAYMNVKNVYISEIIGMGLYLFQAADFIKIEKDENYIKNSKVGISRRMVEHSDGTKSFFYEKYKECLTCAIDTQIV